MIETTGQRCITCAAPERTDTKTRKRVTLHTKGCPDHLRVGHRTERDMPQEKITVPGLVTDLDAREDWRLFTFGIGSDLADRVIAWAVGSTPDVARARMIQRFGRDWAFEYNATRGRELIKRYGYRPLAPEEIPPTRADLDPDLQAYVDGLLAVKGGE
jgi:hypothetical protein